MSVLGETLVRIEEWLLQNHPDAIVDLLPGLSSYEVEAMVTEFPLRLSNELYELYQWHNGMQRESPYSRLIFIRYCFNSLWDALSKYKRYMSIQKNIGGDTSFSIFWDSAWLPVFSSNRTDLVLVCNQELLSSSVHERYNASNDFRIKYSSISNMMLVALECYEQGVYIPTYQEDLLVFEADYEREEAIRQKYNPGTGSFLCY